MRIREVFRFAFAGLKANKLRSALTTLGILIGVGAVILLVAVGKGSGAQVQANIDKLGTNLLEVSGPGPECQAIQYMNDLLIKEQFLIKASCSLSTEAKSRYKQRRAEQLCYAFHGLPFENLSIYIPEGPSRAKKVCGEQQCQIVGAVDEDTGGRVRLFAGVAEDDTEDEYPDERVEVVADRSDMVQKCATINRPWIELLIEPHLIRDHVVGQTKRCGRFLDLPLNGALSGESIA